MSTETTAKLNLDPGVKVGDVITRTCVTMGIEYTGTVAEVIGPIRMPDCGGFRAKLVNTGEFYGGGAPIEPTVYL